MRVYLKVILLEGSLLFNYLSIMDNVNIVERFQVGDIVEYSCEEIHFSAVIKILEINEDSNTWRVELMMLRTHGESSVWQHHYDIGGIYKWFSNSFTDHVNKWTYKLLSRSGI